ncbi:MAG: hypothetical protein E7277_03775 [Lachnospiraceae bacterium]|nr:hypothetical protein [Lachnospiraceae bacterium]
MKAKIARHAILWDIFWAAMGTACMTRTSELHPLVVGGIIGLIGTVAGYFTLKWYDKEKTK